MSETPPVSRFRMMVPSRWFLTVLLALPASAAEPERELRERVNLAIDRGVAWLLGHEKGGRLNVHGHDGYLALSLYTLLKSGVRPSHPVIVDGFERLRKPQGNNYTAACILLALTVGRPDGWREWMQDLVDRVVGWQSAGAWGYPSGEDLSNTQYAALGLFAAARAGARVPVGTWEDLADAVHDYRQSDGGHSYHRNGTSYGSMTAAGVGTLAICRERLSYSGGLDAKLAAVLEEDIEAGLDWLGRKFSVTENPGRSGTWHYYYLYGLERVGALCATPTLGGHDWYREGAEYLVDAQSADGAWSGGMGGHGELTTTCFALLFLHRATAPLSPRAPQTASGQVYGRDDPELDVSLRGAGDTPLELWISRFGRRVLEELAWPGESGLRVAQVVYYVNGEPFHTIQGELERPSEREYYELEHEFGEPGKYKIDVVVDVLAPPVATDDGRTSTSVVQLRSPSFLVTVNGVDPAWIRSLKELAQYDVWPREVVVARASSVFQGLNPWTGEHFTSDGLHAVDGDPDTSWLSRPDDEEPWLRLTTQKKVQADTVVLCHARARLAAPRDFARAGSVELIVNRKQRYRVHLGPGIRTPTVFRLPEPVEIRSVELQITSRTTGAVVDGVGFAEVLLLDRSTAE